MGSLHTLASTCNDFWNGIPPSLLQAVVVLLSTTSLLVASRTRGTSRDAQQTSQAALSLSLLHSVPPDSSESPPDAPAPKSA